MDQMSRFNKSEVELNFVKVSNLSRAIGTPGNQYLLTIPFIAHQQSIKMGKA